MTNKFVILDEVKLLNVTPSPNAHSAPTTGITPPSYRQIMASQTPVFVRKIRKVAVRASHIISFVEKENENGDKLLQLKLKDRQDDLQVVGITILELASLLNDMEYVEAADD